MKKSLLLLFALLFAGFARGQVTLTIDSLDLSRDETIIEKRGIGCITQASCDGFTPRMKMIATVRNNTDKRIFIPQFNPYMEDTRSYMQFTYDHKVYSKYIIWTNPNLYPLREGGCGFWINPNESRRMVLWSFIPSPNDPARRINNPLYVTFPKEWDWNGEAIAPDSVYLQWMKTVLPTIKFKTFYLIMRKNAEFKQRNVKRLVSEPIDPEKIVFTHGLTFEDDDLFELIGLF